MKLHARTLPPDCWRRLRDSLDHWPEAALLLDPEGRVAAANPAAQSQWQRGGEPLQGRPAATLLSDLRRRGDALPRRAARQPANGLRRGRGRAGPRLAAALPAAGR
jgi:PAS domain-containing protein